MSCFKWSLIQFKIAKAGVPHGSVLGPLLFLIYINDMCDDLNSDSFLFADDTNIFKVVNNNVLQAAKIINEDLDKINSWTKKWLVSINTTKTISCFSLKKTSTFKCTTSSSRNS